MKTSATSQGHGLSQSDILIRANKLMDESYMLMRSARRLTLILAIQATAAISCIAAEPLYRCDVDPTSLRSLIENSNPMDRVAQLSKITMDGIPLQPVIQDQSRRESFTLPKLPPPKPKPRTLRDMIESHVPERTLSEVSTAKSLLDRSAEILEATDLIDRGAKSKVDALLSTKQNLEQVRSKALTGYAASQGIRRFLLQDK